MNCKQMKIAIATSTRADWGLLSPLAKSLSNQPNVSIDIIATNMHYAEEYGYTWKEIVADGFSISAEVPTHGTPAEIMSQTLIGFSQSLKKLSPDCIVILGDRFEMLAAASAAALERVPIVHIAGGAISEGAFDDSFRHAITKLSTLHLTETEEYRNRVIQLGEQPQRVINTGAIGVYNLKSLTLMPKEELERSIDFSLTEKSFLVTLHPATLDRLSPLQQLENLIDALNRFPDYKILFTHPNNDTDNEILISRINEFRDSQPNRVCVVPSLGRIRYLSALKYVTAVVGNSSSGLTEVPSAGIPTLDIGVRQQGRTAGESVCHCDSSVEAIVNGLAVITSEDFISKAKKSRNPYEQPDTLKKMVDAIISFPFEDVAIKKFYDFGKSLDVKPISAPITMKNHIDEEAFNDDDSTLFVIPARGGSKGIPGKNIKLFAGKPLICYSIDCARQFVDDRHICLTTDSEEIINVAKEYGLDVPFIRPAELASDTSGTYEVLLHAVKFYADRGIHYKRMVLLQPTSPLRTYEDVKMCLDKYTEDIDMVVSVKEASTNPYYNAYEVDEEGFLMISKGEGRYTRRQDVPKVWEYNGAVYVINIESLKRCSLGEFKRRRMSEMPARRSVDLDTQMDWDIAEAIYKSLQSNQ